MKVCYIGWGDSIHMQRIVKWFMRKGHEIHLITCRPIDLDNVVIHDIGCENPVRISIFGQGRVVTNVLIGKSCRTPPGSLSATMYIVTIVLAGKFEIVILDDPGAEYVYEPLSQILGPPLSARYFT